MYPTSQLFSITVQKTNRDYGKKKTKKKQKKKQKKTPKKQQRSYAKD